MALQRNSGDKPRFVWASKSNDSGMHWSSVRATDVANPNSAVTGLRLDASTLLMIGNDRAEERDRLSLLRSMDNGDSHCHSNNHA